jgi:mRNA-degrading endonuclease RelE of RelBE toxin-antitoxin system
MALLIPARVENEIDAMPAADGLRLMNRLMTIAADPHRRHPNVLPLAGKPGLYRVRQGNWRALFVSRLPM